MNHNDHAVIGGGTIAFVGSDEFIAALDRAASQTLETRSAFARRILADHLRNTGHLTDDMPVARHDACRREVEHVSRGPRRSRRAAA